MNITFTDRISYLAWVKTWKAEYKAMSEDIRTIRNTMKASARADDGDEGFHAARKHRLRGHATNMIELRHEAKRVAQEQYLAERDSRQNTKQAA